MAANKTSQLTLSAMSIALALLIPRLLHSIPNAGTLLLPMHFPVLLGAFFLEPGYALLVGVLSPVLSTLITGMPPSFPVLPFMIAEMGIYALAASLLFRKLKLDKSIALVGAMVLGRLAASLAVWVLVLAFGAKLPAPWTFFAAAITGSLPGIAIQLATIPAIVSIVQKGRVSR
jgi:riboflavin transporter FmnP